MQAFHLIGAAPFYTNSFLLITKAGHAVIIDPAAEVQEYDKILREKGAVLTHILCTHGHYDHVGSAGVLSREWGAKVWCEPTDCGGTQLFPLKSADFGYEEGGNLTVDELTFTAWHTPGHTEGSVVLLCSTYLFVGDTVFQGSIGRTDLEGGSSAQMVESLRKLAKLPIPRQTQVLPGHGEFSTFGEELDNNYFIRSAQRVAETPGTYSPHDSDLESLLLTLCKELTPSEQKQLMSLLLREGITGLLLRLGIRDR